MTLRTPTATPIPAPIAAFMGSTFTVPSDAAPHEAHCRRVAAFCGELAGALEISAADRSALHEAALHHHDFVESMLTDRLVFDLRIPEPGLTPDQEASITPLAHAILDCLRGIEGPSPDNGQAGALARILDMANHFDEQLEFAPFEDLEIVDKFAASAPQPDPIVTFVLSKLRRIERPQVLQLSGRLPVFPKLALSAMGTLSNPDTALATLERIASSDPVLAGSLLKCANSAAFSPRQPIKAVGRAIAYMGCSQARQVLLAAALRPLLNGPDVGDLWQHSLKSAQIAERLAACSTRVDPAEAFTLGLMHDVGKLLLALVPPSIGKAQQKLVESGCPPAIAELVLCGFDHAGAGAAVLETWQFPPESVAAVKHHHQPERTDSAMAAILYLTEFWTESEEDAPSAARFQAALTNSGLKTEHLNASTLKVKDFLTVV